jgi:NADH pyrophosphatase NudC (nudix superfamily)
MSNYKFCPVCAASLVTRHDGERERAHCPACQWTHWNNPAPVVAALIELEGRILLARNAAWPNGMFGLITGFLESGETPEQGVAREVLEETGLQTHSTELLGVYEFTRKNELIIGYHVRASGDIQLNEELAEYRLIAPEKLRPWPSGTGLAMAEWLNRRKIPFEFLEVETVKKIVRGEQKEEV